MPAKLSADLTTVERILSAADPLAEFAKRRSHLTGWTPDLADADFVEPDR